MSLKERFCVLGCKGREGAEVGMLVWEGQNVQKEHGADRWMWEDCGEIYQKGWGSWSGELSVQFSESSRLPCSMLFYVNIDFFTVCVWNLNLVGALHTSVHGGCVHNLSSRIVHLKQEAEPFKNPAMLGLGSTSWEPHSPHPVATPPALLQHPQVWPQSPIFLFPFIFLHFPPLAQTHSSCLPPLRLHSNHPILHGQDLPILGTCGVFSELLQEICWSEWWWSRHPPRLLPVTAP